MMRTASLAQDWRSAARTDIGKVRVRNEDAFLDLPEQGLWVVADGMGGHHNGALASRLIVEQLAELPEGSLAERLASSVLPVETHVLLMQHYERSGQFAKAENSLFAALDLLPGSPALLHIGLAFYQRLLGKSDAALEAGDLPRAEVESGRTEFRAKFTGQAL